MIEVIEEKTGKRTLVGKLAVNSTFMINERLYLVVNCLFDDSNEEERDEKFYIDLRTGKSEELTGNSVVRPVELTAKVVDK